MLVQFEGQEYQFDIEALDLSEARYIKRNAGLSIKGLMDGLSEMDPDALSALYWLMLKQNGQVQDIGKLNFPLLKFAEALGDAYDRAEAEELGITVEELRERRKAEAEGKENPTEAALAASQA